ncbi:MAG: citrate/2-methylcitrate synthase, partial [Actinomycetota bacterium]|nr:citrate/2-methylcitrate synthase [Actinomycetota bacterium]
MTDDDPRLLSASDAAAVLGVKLETLYAYASRGIVTSQRRPGSRGSWFDPVELDAVARRSRRGGPARLADMRFQSSITLVEHGAYYYRGADPLELARSTSFEAVAEMLWSGSDPLTGPTWTVDHEAVELGRGAAAQLPRRSSVLDRLRAIVPVVGAGDDLRFDLRPEAVASRGGAILASIAAACGSRDSVRHVERVWMTLTDRPPTTAELALVETALVLLADHEVAASTAAVRIAASFRADPYAALGSGLAVLSGAYHGAASIDAVRLLAEAVDVGPAVAVGEVLRRDGRVPGLGQTLYPDGDPRYNALLDQIEAAQPSSVVALAAREVEAIAVERG